MGGNSMFFEEGSWLRKRIWNFLSVMSFPRLPIKCPKCHKRSFIQTYLQRDDSGEDQMHCTKCEIIFTEKTPKKYKLTPLAQYEQLKQRLIGGN